MKCKNCGTEFEEGVFCPECGTSQIFTCPKCAKEINENSKFCPECGEKIQELYYE